MFRQFWKDIDSLTFDRLTLEITFSVIQIVVFVNKSLVYIENEDKTNKREGRNEAFFSKSTLTGCLN